MQSVAVGQGLPSDCIGESAESSRFNVVTGSALYRCSAAWKCRHASDVVVTHATGSGVSPMLKQGN